MTGRLSALGAVLLYTSPLTAGLSGARLYWILPLAVVFCLSVVVLTSRRLPRGWLAAASMVPLKENDCQPLIRKEATPGGETKGFRYQGAGVLLTYNGVRDQAQWRAFVTHVHAHVTAWQLKYWCATLEATKTERLHIHLMVQHLSAMDRTITRFRFQGLTPNAQPNDVLGEGFSRKKMQESLNRAFFYCWADKIGTQRDAAGAQQLACDGRRARDVGLARSQPSLSARGPVGIGNPAICTRFVLRLALGVR